MRKSNMILNAVALSAATAGLIAAAATTAGAQTRPCHPTHSTWHRIGSTSSSWSYVTKRQATDTNAFFHTHIGCKAYIVATPKQSHMFTGSGLELPNGS